LNDNNICRISTNIEIFKGMNYIELIIWLIFTFYIIKYYNELNIFLQEIYKLFKAIHADIKKLYNENQELKKEVCELKSTVVNSNLGGNNKKNMVLNYDSSWLIVCIFFK